MKNFAKLFLLFGVAMLTFVACDTPDVPDTPTTTPVVTLAQDVVAAAAEGGSYSLGYTIADAVEGANLSVKNDADWVTNITVTDTEISFEVAANEAEAERIVRAAERRFAGEPGQASR